MSKSYLINAASTCVFVVGAICVLACYCTTASGALTDGLGAYFPFSGNANDQSGNGNDGVVNGAVLTFDRFGQANSAYSFDGIDDNIQVSASSSLDIQNAITLSAWVYHLSSLSPQHIVNHSDVQTGYRLASWTANPQGNSLELYDDKQLQHAVDDGELPTVGMWTHIAGTWDGSVMRIYRNGLLANSALFSGTIGSASNDLFIGDLVLPGYPVQGPFHGYIDEVRVYNRALTDDEVYQLATIPIPPAFYLFGSGVLALLGIARNKLFSSFINGVFGSHSPLQGMTKYTNVKVHLKNSNVRNCFPGISLRPPDDRLAH